MRRPSLFKTIRVTALIAVWAFITYSAYTHQQCGERPDGAPTVHALCPLGGLATLHETVTKGEYLKRTHPHPLRRHTYPRSDLSPRILRLDLPAGGDAGAFRDDRTKVWMAALAG